MKLKLESVTMVINSQAYVVSICFESNIMAETGKIFYNPKPIAKIGDVVLKDTKITNKESGSDESNLEMFVETNLEAINECILSGDYDDLILESYEVGMESIRKIQAVLGTKPKKQQVSKADVAAGRIAASKSNDASGHNWAPRGELKDGSTLLNDRDFLVIDSKTGSVFKEYNNISNCCKELNLNYGHVLSCLRKERPTHEGYRFQYVDEK